MSVEAFGGSVGTALTWVTVHLLSGWRKAVEPQVSLQEVLNIRNLLLLSLDLLLVHSHLGAPTRSREDADWSGVSASCRRKLSDVCLA